MYYQNYEDYMRSVLGYPIESTYDNYIIQNREYNVNYQNNSELESMYPEIYKKINPVVCEVCERNKTPITKEIIENMVEEVYQRIEINNEIWLKINVDENITQKEIQNFQLDPHVQDHHSQDQEGHHFQEDQEACHHAHNLETMKTILNSKI